MSLDRSTGMHFALIGSLLVLALAGNARIGLFVLNRAVFGEKHESKRMKWAMIGVPPLLLLLALLYFPAWLWMRHGLYSVWGAFGTLWLGLNVITGVFWIVDTGWHNLHPLRIRGIRSDPPQVIRLRRAHIPFRFLRRLGAHNDLYDIEITSHEVMIPDLPHAFDGYHIAFLTDLHVTGFMRRAFYREIVNQINRRGIDLVLLGGDFVTWRRHIPLMAELLSDLESKDGVIAVLGNHDYWADADGIVAALTVRGVRFVINRSIAIERDGARIDLLGIDEVYRGEPDVDAAFLDVPGDRPCIGISHHPDIIDLLDEHRIDLLVCGHTHGGQIRLPFFGAIVVPSIHEGRYAAGFFRQKNVLMYVSRGIGSVPPIRILCRPEVALFTLRRESSER